jgi:hypothetical protein
MRYLILNLGCQGDQGHHYGLLDAGDDLLRPAKKVRPCFEF